MLMVVLFMIARLKSHICMIVCIYYKIYMYIMHCIHIICIVSFKDKEGERHNKE